MNKKKFRLDIKYTLLFLSGVLVVLLGVLLLADILVFDQIRSTQRTQAGLREQLSAVNEAQTEFGAAALALHDTALTGNLTSEQQAAQHFAAAKAALMRSGAAEDQAELQQVSADIDALLDTGYRMTRAYLLAGREAGNRINYAPQDGFDAQAKKVRLAIDEHAQHIQGLVGESRDQLVEAESLGRGVVFTGTGFLLVAAPFAFFLFFRKLMGLVRRITDTVQSVSGGDFTARCLVHSGDEMQTLGDAFDDLLDARVSTLAQIERENNAINDSIIRILEATGSLSQRDLRVNVPVAEDITGAVADAINGAVSDMASVLKRVRAVSGEVRDSSGTVDQQAQKVYQVAQRNLATVENTLKDLRQATESMEKVMALAAMSHTIAGTATQSTSQGLESVMSTTEGMNRIRSSIQETAKRIKRLGERSQEISGIIGIIKDITERTHVLALNARIQASTAGEAGKGFSVVAEEVKQLAESSRQATAQIAQLIQNIQIETNDTIATMEQTVSEVVKGTELSEKARAQMQDTQQTTGKLAEAVKQIATSSKMQMKITKDVAVRAEELRAAAVNTQKELEVQRQQSRRLTVSSEQLAQSVAQFVLPESA